MRHLGAVALLLLPASCQGARGVVVKKAAALPRAEQRIGNPGLETMEGRGFAGWRGWERGYQADAHIRHSGTHGARCHNVSGQEHGGLTCEVRLNQKVAAPVTAECWSRAEGVSGGRDGNYSLYLDIEYRDGTSLWGNIAAFDPGTHGWQKRTVTVTPAKPIRTVYVHGIFRARTGTAWFDDFRLWERNLPPGTRQFDGVPVVSTLAAPMNHKPWPALRTGDGLVLRFDNAAGLFLRDAAARSDFIKPRALAKRQPDGSVRLDGRDDILGLRLSTTCRVVGGAIRMDCTVEDLRRRDRAITAYFTYPVDAVGWRWHDDQRASRRIEKGQQYGNFVAVGAGQNGLAARYPLACISGGKEALAIGAPLDRPRLWRFGYDADSRELYAAVDLGLSAATKRFPSQAGFSLVLYRCDPAWGFRSALKRYYDLFPHCFVKRNKAEGIWMPFTDIATVEGFEDFGFQFKEGIDNVAFDEEQGIRSFVYVEPMSLWVGMPKEMERTNERAVALVRQRAVSGASGAKAAITSVIADPSGEWIGGTVKAPWCDGAVYHLNANPSLRAADAGGLTQFAHKWGTIAKSFDAGGPGIGTWQKWDRGYLMASEEGRRGSRAARMSRREGEGGAGVSQLVYLNQTEPRPLTARAWTRAESVTGAPSPDYSLYVDLSYSDGSAGYAFVVPAATGTHDWLLLEQTIRPPKPVRSLICHLLLRAPHTGTVWFDDASLSEGDGPNLLKGGDFDTHMVEPAVDGTYIDSYEMGSKLLNYRREHLAATEEPLVFDSEGRVCQLLVFHTTEFARAIARRMWAQGKMTFANATPVDFPWAAAWLDVMGIETDWGPGGKYEPNPDWLMNWRRALCHQRPYLLLLNTRYEKFKPEWVELYFKRCAAYGIFPSMFSENAADRPYWQRPDLYNRDRPLFKKYVPVISALSAAGWEPVTHARSDNHKVYVERFGKPGGPLYLTLFNDSHEPERARITVDAAALELCRGGALLRPSTGAAVLLPYKCELRQAAGLPAHAVKEVLGGRRFALTVRGHIAVLHVAIEPEDVTVIRLR